MTLRTITFASTLACALLCCTVPARLLAATESPVVATDMRIGGDDKQTRVVVDLNRKVDLAAFTLADPYRVVVDLPQVTFKLPAKASEQSRGLVKAFRYGLIMRIPNGELISTSPITGFRTGTATRV